MKIMCWLGIHWRITVDRTLFVDQVSGKEVYEGKCRCGRTWMHDSVFGFPTFKVERNPLKDAGVYDAVAGRATVIEKPDGTTEAVKVKAKEAKKCYPFSTETCQRPECNCREEKEAKK